VFQDWVFEEVLPSIRKTGSYNINQLEKLPNFEDPAEAAEAWAKQYRAKQLEIKAHNETKVELKETKQVVSTLESKLDLLTNYSDRILIRTMTNNIIDEYIKNNQPNSSTYDEWRTNFRYQVYKTLKDKTKVNIPTRSNNLDSDCHKRQGKKDKNKLVKYSSIIECIDEKYGLFRELLQLVAGLCPKEFSKYSEMYLNINKLSVV
jgi:hypothetical protein